MYKVRKEKNVKDSFRHNHLRVFILFINATIFICLLPNKVIFEQGNKCVEL